VTIVDVCGRAGGLGARYAALTARVASSDIDRYRQTMNRGKPAGVPPSDL